jgi:Leucine-rich repeat (LRR) protein
MLLWNFNNIGNIFLFQNKLTMLDIASNRIKKIENISHLTELQEFWVSFNLSRIGIHLLGSVSPLSKACE